MGNEEDCHRHVDRGRIHVERESCRHDEADDFLRTTQLFEFFHATRHHRLGRGRGKNEQNFLLEVSENSRQPEAAEPEHESEHHHDETQADRKDRKHELAEIKQRLDAELRDSERDGGTGADRGEVHDHADHGE